MNTESQLYDFLESANESIQQMPPARMRRAIEGTSSAPKRKVIFAPGGSTRQISLKQYTTGAIGGNKVVWISSLTERRESVKSGRPNTIESRLKRIQRAVTFRDNFKSQIQAFLQQNDGVASFIEYSIPKIRSVFPNAELAAELFTYDETSTELSGITLFIKSKLSTEETLRRMGELDRKYGVDLFRRSDKKICIMEEYD